MPLKFIIGEPGSGKSYRAAEEIKALAEKKKNVTLIVPEQYSSEAERKLYGVLGISLFNNIKVETFTRIRDKIFKKSGGNKGELPSEAAKAAVMFTVKKELAGEEPEFFKSRINSPSFALSALKIVRELEMNGIEADELISDKINDGALKNKIKDIAALCRRYNDRLTECGYTNALSDGMKAAELAESTGFFKDEHIFIDEFKSFTADELRLIDAMKSQGYLTVCMPTPDKNLFSSPVFSSVNETVSRIDKNGEAEYIVVCGKKDRFEKAPDIKFIGQSILRAKKTERINSQNIVIAQSSDMSAEADFVCSEISKYVRNGTYKYSDFAVLSRDFENLRGILETDFIRYEIPYFMDMTRSAGSEPLIIFAMTLLEAADREKLDTETFLKILKTGFTDASDEDISETENYFLEHGIRKIDWSEISEFVNDPEESDDTALKTKNIKNKTLFPVSVFRGALKETHSLRYIVNEFCRLLNSYDLAEKSVRGFSEDTKEGRDILRVKKALAESIISVSEIHLSAGADNFTLSEFREIFGIIISEAKISAPAHSVNGVMAASSDRARLSSPKVVFIMGASDGYFPFKVKGSGVFTERELETLENALGIRFSERIGRMAAEENFIAVSSVSAPSEKLFITYSLSDISGKSRYVSDLTKFIADKAGLEIQDISKKEADYFIVNENTARYQYVKNLHKSHELSGDKLAAANEIYGEDFEKFALNSYNLSGSILSDSIYKIKISEENAEKIYLSGRNNLNISASSLEKYAKCPFMFFCDKGLKLRVTKPHAFLSNVRGNEIHNSLNVILSHILDESKEKGVSFHEYFSSLSDEYLNELTEKTVNDYYEKTFKEEGYESTPSFMKAYFREKDEILEVILHLRDEFSPDNSKYIPAGFEYRIGKSSSDDRGMNAWKIDFVSDGGKKYNAYFKGMVDRIDTFTDASGKEEKKYIRVIDYKSGNKNFDFADLYDGLNMQMLVYLFAVTDDRFAYEDFSGCIPAGIMYYPSKSAKPAKNSSGKRNPDTPDALRKIIDNEMKMDGFTLTNVSSIRAMENKANGVFIPQVLNFEAVRKKINSLGNAYRKNSDEGKAVFEICSTAVSENKFDEFTYDLLCACISDKNNAVKNLFEKYDIGEKASEDILSKLDGIDFDSPNESRDIFMAFVKEYRNFDKKPSGELEENAKKEIEELFTSPAGKISYPSDKISLTEDELNNLKDYTVGKIREICGNICDGKAMTYPMYQSSNVQCDLCDYRSMCENCESKLSTIRFRDKNAKEKIRGIIKGQEDK